MGFLSREEIKGLGFAEVGDHVFLSDKASYYNCAGIVIGNNVRIDDFCVLSAGEGGIEIADYVHIAVYSSLIGRGKITLSDYCNVSSRVAIYSSNDDYNGGWMTNPMVPAEYTNVTHADVVVGRHVIIGAGSILLPGVTLGEGVAIGALSLVSKSCHEFGVYAGVPAKRVRDRGKGLLRVEQKFIEGLGPAKSIEQS